MVAIKLRRRYREGADYKNQKSRGGNAGASKHNKLTSSQKQTLAPVPQKVMRIDAATGQRKMIWTGKMLKHTGTVLVEM